MVKFRFFVAALLLVAFGSAAQSQEGTLTLNVLGTYETGIFDEGAQEIGAYDASSQRFFVINAQANVVEILDISDPANIALVSQVSLDEFGAGVNSVAAFDGLIAAAVQGAAVDTPGTVVFMDVDGNVLNSVEAGVLPDMVTFSPDGSRVFTANEGEPSAAYDIDPEGSVTIIDLSEGVENATAVQVSFEAFNDGAPEGVRIFGPGASVAQDLEPEYVAVSPDGSTVFVSLQENNAIAVVDAASASVSAIWSLGTKDYSLEENAIDPSNEDGGINIRPVPAVGLYLPDAIAAYSVDGVTYIVTANEGDARDYEGFAEEARVGDEEIVLDPEAYPNAEELKAEDNLGRLLLTVTEGDSDGDGDIDLIHSFGARSFSIFTAAGELVYDSGSEFERITADLVPTAFNSQGANESFDNRSDDKGPEPEGVTIGEIDGRVYAFIGLERVGGVMVYDISDPANSSFVTYANNVNLEGSAEEGSAGDIAPEGLVFIDAMDSPTGTPLLIVTNEVSGSTTIYEIIAG